LPIHALPLAHEEVTHHLLAFGQRLGFQMIQGGLLGKAAGIGDLYLDAVQFGQVIRLVLIVDAADQDRQTAHGTPPVSMERHGCPMIRSTLPRPLPTTDQAQRFCALTNF